MTLKDVFIRFSLTYVLLIFAIIIIKTILNHIGATIPSVSIFILIGTIFYTCQTFTKKNKRYFTAEEKKKVIIGFFIINFLVEGILLTLGVVAGTLPSNAFLIAIGLVIIINPIIIYIFVGIAGLGVKKQDADKVIET